PEHERHVSLPQLRCERDFNPHRQSAAVADLNNLTAISVEKSNRFDPHQSGSIVDLFLGIERATGARLHVEDFFLPVRSAGKLRVDRYGAVGAEHAQVNSVSPLIAPAQPS